MDLIFIGLCVAAVVGVVMYLFLMVERDKYRAAFEREFKLNKQYAYTLARQRAESAAVEGQLAKAEAQLEEAGLLIRAGS